jgi:hypothetical protein
MLYFDSCAANGIGRGQAWLPGTPWGPLSGCEGDLGRIGAHCVAAPLRIAPSASVSGRRGSYCSRRIALRNPLFVGMLCYH